MQRLHLYKSKLLFVSCFFFCNIKHAINKAINKVKAKNVKGLLRNL